MVKHEPARAEAASAPFGVCALPTAAHVPDEHVRMAFDAMCSMFPDGPVAKRIKGGLEEAHARSAWVFTDRTIRTQTQTVTLATSGEDIVCSCPDWTFKRTVHHGMCRHVCAVELVRLAQARVILSHPTVVADVSLAPSVLRSVLTCALASPSSNDGIHFTFTQNILTVSTETLAVRLRCDGYGECTLLLQRQHLIDLIDQLAETDDESVMLQVTPTHLDVLGDTLEVSVAVG